MTDNRTLADRLREAPFALAMSSGFFGFYAHTGVLAALEDEGLEPQSVRGSSAGALVTAAWASGLSAASLSRELTALQRQDFWDPRPGFGLLAGRKFDGILRRILPHQDFARCRVPVALSVFDVLSRRTELVEEGDLAIAIRASCALPFLFQPVWMNGRPKLDGGIADRPGLHGAIPGERILYHHLLPSSPWRRREGVHAQPPRRDGLFALATPGLPKLSPFALAEGTEAFRIARAYTRRALGEPCPAVLGL